MLTKKLKVLVHWKCKATVEPSPRRSSTRLKLPSTWSYGRIRNHTNIETTPAQSQSTFRHCCSATCRGEFGCHSIFPYRRVSGMAGLPMTQARNGISICSQKRCTKKQLMAKNRRQFKTNYYLFVRRNVSGRGDDVGAGRRRRH